MNAKAIIDELELSPHPEGGFYRETWRHTPTGDNARGAGTAIYYLLRAEDNARWHRVDATEIWHLYAGGPLDLVLARPGQPREVHTLGTDLTSGHRPQVIVPAGAWQRARSVGDYTLVGCTVSPAFTFEGFELAPEDFEP